MIGSFGFVPARSDFVLGGTIGETMAWIAIHCRKVAEEHMAIAEKAESGSRIIFRTAGAGSPIESRLPQILRERFSYEKETSERLFKLDRASIYGGFHLYVLR